MWVVGGIFVLWVFGSLIRNTGWYQEQERREQKESREFMCRETARDAGHRCLIDRLKAPRTAKFVEENVTMLSSTEAIYYAQVDAQNSFGAMIRDDFYIRLRLEQGEWTCLD
jgi:hypothetical protein